jgi:hypothetical protein
MRGVIPEAAELLEEGLVSPDDFRRFVYENPVRLHGSLNPRFFEGTRVANEARALLAPAAEEREIS